MEGPWPENMKALESGGIKFSRGREDLKPLRHSAARYVFWQTDASGALRRAFGACQVGLQLERNGSCTISAGGGIHATAVGYAAGQTPNPTYEDL